MNYCCNPHYVCSRIIQFENGPIVRAFFCHGIGAPLAHACAVAIAVAIEYKLPLLLRTSKFAPFIFPGPTISLKLLPERKNVWLSVTTFSFCILPDAERSTGAISCTAPAAMPNCTHAAVISSAVSVFSHASPGTFFAERIFNAAEIGKPAAPDIFKRLGPAAAVGMKKREGEPAAFGKHQPPGCLHCTVVPPDSLFRCRHTPATRWWRAHHRHQRAAAAYDTGHRSALPRPAPSVPPAARRAPFPGAARRRDSPQGEYD